MKNINEFIIKKQKQEMISMVTCYDYWTANILKDTPIDCLLVGDSVSMVVHGYESTIHATIEMMATHTQAVSRAQTGKFIIADLPFLYHRKGKKHLMDGVEKLMKAGAHALKIETAPGQEDIVQFISESGVPMIGHVGLTPQYFHQMGGYKVQGKTAEAYQRILSHAQDLQNAGCHALVLECVPSALAEELTESLHIPTIGIGAGSQVNGQVLVLQDLLGLNRDFKPRFVRQFVDGNQWMSQALTDFTTAVSKKTFPKPEESFQ